MFAEGDDSARYRAQELMWNAMDLVGQDNERAKSICLEALEVYPDCVDALSLLADLDSELVTDYVDAMRAAVAAGRRDLGPDVFSQERGYFWGIIETRPFMRAMGQLVQALIEWGTVPCIDEAIALQQEMLELNPGDNQGVRYGLVACYLQRKQYRQAADLLKQYEDDGMAVWPWARVILAHATDDSELDTHLAEAHGSNPHVEKYLSGQKRRPRNPPSYYGMGDDAEAVTCVNILWNAWKKHPEAKRWVKEQINA